MLVQSVDLHLEREPGLAGVVQEGGEFGEFVERGLPAMLIVGDPYMTLGLLPFESLAQRGEPLDSVDMDWYRYRWCDDSW